jgi:hypothetical protein
VVYLKSLSIDCPLFSGTDCSFGKQTQCNHVNLELFLWIKFTGIRVSKLLDNLQLAFLLYISAHCELQNKLIERSRMFTTVAIKIQSARHELWIGSIIGIFKGLNSLFVVALHQGGSLQCSLMKTMWEVVSSLIYTESNVVSTPFGLRKFNSYYYCLIHNNTPKIFSLYFGE